MQRSSQAGSRPRVVVVGAGFGGIAVVRRLARAPVDVLLVDRNNYHTFWPLLYQVASAALEPQQIAYPVRAILRGIPNVRFRIGEVEGVDLDRQEVVTTDGVLPYDELVISAGSANNFFGLDEVKQHAFGFKELPEALAVRNHLIMCFERASIEAEPAQLDQLLTFVVVGGGPTGVELAGAIAELNRHVMRRDYPQLDFTHVRVLLIEMMDRVLLSFPDTLARRAHDALDSLGVEVRLGASVSDFQNDILRLKDGTEIPTRTVIWAAGIQGAKLGERLGVPLQRGARVAVTSALHIPDRPNVWVIGDLSYLEGPAGKPYPQLATVALQQGHHVASNIRRKLRGLPPRPFRYIDKGSMATVGRRFAVARVWGMNWSGTVAWVLWLVVHLLYLAGMRNRVLVLVNWAYNYFTYDRAARSIVRAWQSPQAEKSTAATAATEAAR